MAKKQQAPDAIIKQFEKPQFKINDAVFFTWLGAKKYGYVKTFKTSTWGVQYLVESDDTRYPCGISIKGHKTAYTTGCIYADETRAYGTEELERRCQSGHKSTYSEVIRESGRPKDESGSGNRNVRSVSDNASRKTKKHKANNVGKAGSSNGNNGMQSNNTKKRKNSELDTAIQRQRDFLNGFIKKD